MKSIGCFGAAARLGGGRITAVVLSAAMLSACGGGGYGGGGGGGGMGPGYGGMGATAPSIASASAMPSQMVTAGTKVTFAVSASGTMPLHYQWMFNGGNIAGATMATYAIASASTANSGSYAVTVSNAYGMKTSSPITLTVM